MSRYSLKSFRYIFGMNSVYLGSNYLWTSFESLFLPYEIELLLPVDVQAIYLGLIAFFGIIIGIAFNFISGTLSDRIRSRVGKRRPMILLGSIIVVFALVLGSVIGISYGVFMSVSDALASDMAPPGSSGKFMGYYNIAIGGASSLSPLIYGLILYFSSSYSLGFRYVFYAAGIFFFIGFAMFYKIRKD